MTKRKSFIAILAFVLALSLTLFLGVTLSGRTVSARATDSPSGDSEIQTYNVVLTQGTIQADGETSTSTGGAVAELDIKPGVLVTIIAQEKSNAVFDKWTYSAIVKVTFENENSSTTTFIMPEGEIWIEPKYKVIRSVTVKNGILEGGAISGNFKEGETVKITAEATLGGKEFLKWFTTSENVSFNDENSVATTFVMPAEDVEITALYKSEHNLVLVNEVPATCTANGTRKHYVCEDCGRKFTDEAETKEITDDRDIIIPMAHKFGEWIEEVPATAEATGTKAHKDCEFCHNHFDKDGNKIEDLTLYYTKTVYLRWGTIQVGEKSSTGSSRGYAMLDVAKGTKVTIIAQVKSDEVFVKWLATSGNVTFENENSSTTTFIMPDQDVWLDCEYQSAVVPATKHKVTIGDGSAGGDEFEVGQTVTITAGKAPEGMEFDKWIVVSGEVTFADANSATTTFDMPDGAVEIKATYKRKTLSGGETSATGDSSNKGLNGGAIAGIVIGSVVIVGVGGFAIFWFVIKKKTFAELISAIKGLFKKNKKQ